MYLIELTFGILAFDWLLYYYFTAAPTDSIQRDCLIFSEELCQVINYDPYTALLGVWGTLQLTWVSMLLFVQFVQVARAMTTYENMYGIQDGSASSIVSAFTTTGAPLDPNHPDYTPAAPPSAADDPLGARSAGAHAHQHKHRGFLRQWGRLLGVDTFIETATGRGAATSSAGKKSRRKRNPYSRGYLQNCRDFWCDPAPMFGRRETGDAMLGGQKINYTEIYESPAAMDIGLGRRRGGGYEAVPDEAV